MYTKAFENMKTPLFMFKLNILPRCFLFIFVINDFIRNRKPLFKFLRSEVKNTLDELN